MNFTIQKMRSGESIKILKMSICHFLSIKKKVRHQRYKDLKFF